MVWSKSKKASALPFELAWYPTDQRPPARLDCFRALESTARTWTEWSGRSTYRGPYQDVVESIARGPQGHDL